MGVRIGALPLRPFSAVAAIPGIPLIERPLEERLRSPRSTRRPHRRRLVDSEAGGDRAHHRSAPEHDVAAEHRVGDRGQDAAVDEPPGVEQYLARPEPRHAAVGRCRSAGSTRRGRTRPGQPAPIGPMTMGSSGPALLSFLATGRGPRARGDPLREVVQRSSVSSRLDDRSRSHVILGGSGRRSAGPFVPLRRAVRPLRGRPALLGQEVVPAAGRAEVVGGPIPAGGRRRARRIDLHAADRVHGPLGLGGADLDLGLRRLRLASADATSISRGPSGPGGRLPVGGCYTWEPPDLPAALMAEAASVNSARHCSSGSVVEARSSSSTTS